MDAETDAVGDHSGPRRLLYPGGIAPAYFKLIYYVPADEILTHRVIWSFFFMVALTSVSRQWPQVKKLLKNAAQDLPAGALGSAGRR